MPPLLCGNLHIPPNVSIKRELQHITQFQLFIGIFCMKIAINLLVFTLFVFKSSLSLGQVADTAFHKVKTENALELAYKPISEDGDPLAFIASIDNIPKYPGGFKALAKFIRKDIEYPETAIDDNIEGRVICLFIVDKKGNINNVRIVNGVRSDLDSTCIRTLYKLPHWTAGTNDLGENISFQFQISVFFKLRGPSKKK